MLDRSDREYDHGVMIVSELRGLQNVLYLIGPLICLFCVRSDRYRPWQMRTVIGKLIFVQDPRQDMV